MVGCRNTATGRQDAPDALANSACVTASAHSCNPCKRWSGSPPHLVCGVQAQRTAQRDAKLCPLQADGGQPLLAVPQLGIPLHVHALPVPAGLQATVTKLCTQPVLASSWVQQRPQLSKPTTSRPGPLPPGRLPSKGAHVPNNLVDGGALESVAGALCGHQMCRTVSGGATGRMSSRMSSSCCTGSRSKATDSTGRESEVVACPSACWAAAHASAPEQRLRKAMAATGAISSKSSITSRPALVDRSRFAISGKQ